MEMIEHASWLRANNQLQKLRGHIDLACQQFGDGQRTQSAREKLMAVRKLIHKGELRC